MDWIDLILIPLLKSVIIVLGLLTAFAYLTYGERRLLGRFQLRYGPNRAGPWGLLQPVADAFKAIFKEEIIPSKVDRVVYLIAPAVAMTAALMAFAIVPVGPTVTLFGREVSLYLVDLNIGVLYLVAVASLGAYGVVLAGWSSDNKYSMLGALRSAAQVISYELPLGLAMVSVILTAGSLSVVEIVKQQGRLPFILLQPLAFLIYFICSLAEINRSPFDFPETENELIAGFATEYGGIKFAIFFMAEYIHMIVASAMIATLFLGGWQGPVLPPVIWFLLKTGLILFVFIWVRASIPRVRYDQLMGLNWRLLLPLALLNLLVTAVVVAMG